MGLHRYNNRYCKTLGCLALWVIVLTLWCQPTQAKLTRTARVALENASDIAYIGADSYVTPDPKNSLTYQEVVNHHENNLRGTRQNKDVISLGHGAKPVWILFSVTNNSDTEDWVLDFGQAMNGRTAIAKKAVLHNVSSGKIIANMPASDNKTASNTINNRAMRLTLERGQTELFALHITPENTLSGTIAPHLISADAYMARPNTGTNLLTNLAYLFFAAMIGVFAAISYLRQNLHYLFFFSYYLLNATLFYLLNTLFFGSFVFIGEIIILLFTLSILLGLSMTRSFFRISFEHHTENIALIAAGGITGGLSLLSLLLLGNSLLGDLAIYIPSALSMFIIAGLAFLYGQDGQYAGMHYAAGWLITLIGLIITILSGTGVLAANPLYLNAYWFALLPQALLFLLSVKKRIEMLEVEARFKRSRENREFQSRARLKHSKESADQDRLLRVIERERELMTELRERERQRTDEMRVAKEMAVDANRAKSAFLAVVSHEIRTPMTGILGILRLLGDTSLNKEQKDYLISIQTSGDTMMALLNDILDFEKIERGSMDLEEIDFDLTKLVQDVVTLMSGHAADKGLALKSEIPDDFPHYLIGDPTRLRQILLNLVNNALKFTQSGEVTIHIGATALEQADELVNADYEIYIGVQDTGIGISEEAQKKLFSPFEQADNTVARRFGGTGLGLAICKRLVEAMGGTISIKSEEGEGSTFHFSLLMSTGQSDRESHHEQQAPYATDLAPMTLLAVEDNEMNQKVLIGFLKKGGHKVTIASSGEEALEIFATQNFNAVLTDINLCGMDGLEIVKTIRGFADPDKAQTPIIAISGNVSDEDVQSYKEAGMNGFLPKPIAPEALYEILGDLQNAPAPQEQEPPISAPESDPKAPISEPEPAPAIATPSTQDHSMKMEMEMEVNMGTETDIEIEDEDDGFDSFEEADFSPPAPAPPAPSDENVALNLGIAQGLLNSLGAESFKGLMDGYLDKADEIIDELLVLKDSDDANTLREKAHEISGMAANFGVQEISKATGVIEHAARDNDLDTARAGIEKLPDLNRRAKEAIAKLLKD